MKPFHKYRRIYLFIRNFTTLLLVFFVAITSFAQTQSETNGENQVIFGIAPFMSPLALAKRMAPLRAYLIDELNKDILIETTTDAGEFAQRTLSGRYDFVMTNPTFALMALSKGKHKLLLTQKRPLSGVIVVLENSPITSLEQLAEKKIGSPPKIGFLGQMIEHYLHDNGLGDKMPEVTYFHSHNDSIYALRLGKIDAAFIASFMQPHLMEKGINLKAISKTEDFPGMCILSNNRIPDSLNASLKQALLRLEDTPENKDVLKKISMPPFRSINLEELELVRPYMPNALKK